MSEQPGRRGFAAVSCYRDRLVALPQRATAGSAGYDILAADDVVLPAGEVTVVPTGIKAYMQPDEYLGIHIRSGLAVRHGLMLINGQGIIDSDYFDNPDNEGHILVAVYNAGREDFRLERGQRFAQAIFYKYLLADDDQPGGTRRGGLGSTGGKSGRIDPVAG
ncbi:MAG: dUTP diphosphatase [Negativicutes bacterium]|nr:dUTP diphosphatase [Negativicutes bacterium]